MAIFNSYVSSPTRGYDVLFPSCKLKLLLGQANNAGIAWEPQPRVACHWLYAPVYQEDNPSSTCSGHSKILKKKPNHWMASTKKLHNENIQLSDFGIPIVHSSITTVIKTTSVRRSVLKCSKHSGHKWPEPATAGTVFTCFYVNRIACTSNIHICYTVNKRIYAL